MIRVVEHELRVVHGEVVGAGDGDVVFDKVGPRIIFGDGVVAEAEPKDVPVVAVGGVGACGGGGVEEAAGAFGEVEELGFDADIPVGVVFEDEGGGVAFFDDAVFEGMLVGLYGNWTWWSRMEGALRGWHTFL